MDEAVAYLNGRLMPESSATLPLNDAGFVLGATVTEQLRTFAGRPFRLDDHLARLGRSLEICRIDPGLSLAEFGRIAQVLVARNHPLLTEGDDLGLVIFVTPGPYPSLTGGRSGGSPTVGLHTFPLAFELWAAKYAEGVALVVTPHQQVPPECWPAELKCRSRLHYYLADQAAAAIEPGARALLLDAQGRVTETATSNVLLYRADSGLVSPPRTHVLPGISLEVVRELAGDLGVPWADRELMPDDVATADEVLLTSTPNCLLPVTRFNGRPIGGGRPGPMFARLLTAWNQRVGLDVAAQAMRFSKR